MKGAPVTKAQQAYWSLLCDHVGCIACRADDRLNNWCSVHHIEGRTKPDAHWLVLPLCAPHHQGTGGNVIAVHINKFRFEQRYGAQLELLRQCAEILAAKGFVLPDPVPGILASLPDTRGVTRCEL
ncbi:hypothetical protein BXT89_14390 [Halopseudomonas pachastrellae]|uniref:Recombinase n=1 Tax=Halopseudomonas pachastrellae TaxID=254161 RepID=A0A1S8DCI4_9GAMM|nr:Ref family recombination enhancement nuclease [Halopseudomonas pachastrellae]ONM43138.1 hypothetical protein BXT89_14390 [Halopseudomonas pachastrellae]SFL71402.1 Recombination enhancement, RecA-dependent nuclease [Halopseudomonas pachastrellae]